MTGAAHVQVIRAMPGMAWPGAAAAGAALPIGGDGWRRIAHGVADAHLAHAPEWSTIIRRAYGHEPLYLAADAAADGAGVLPAFIVRRPLVGTVVTSMPFLDGGGPCSSSPPVCRWLIDRLMAEAHRVGARVVDIRATARLPLDVEPLEHKVNMTLTLPASADDLWRRLDRSVRNQVRKAERAGLTVEFGGRDKLDAFYSVFASRMRELGSPVHHQEFFRAVLDGFGSRARIGIIRKGTGVIGGLITLAFRDATSVPWASCLMRYFALCPNMLLYWETIRQACADGFRRFDFGRSTRGSGTYRFKRQWGAAESPLFWYSIRLGRPQMPVAGGHGRAADGVAKLWRCLPLGLTRRVGPHIRKYLIR